MKGLLFSSKKSLVLGFTAVALIQANSVVPLRIGTVRQLFVDDILIASKHNVELKLNNPMAREVVLRADKPWEGQSLTYPCVFKDGDKFRLYYRASGLPLGSPPKREEGDKRQMLWSFTALAESSDGIHWTKPNLGVVDFQGSRQNNLIWPVAGQSGSDIFPFKDANPQTSPDERYKALANVGEHQLVALGSQDGIRWRLLQKEPVLAY